jgi:hypothetical protein
MLPPNTCHVAAAAAARPVEVVVVEGGARRGALGLRLTAVFACSAQRRPVSRAPVAEVVAMEQVAGEAVPVDEVRAPDWVVVTLLPAGTLEA